MKILITQMSTASRVDQKMKPLAKLAVDHDLTEFAEINPISTNRRNIALRTGADR
ncbi:MAG: hypothetical protein O2967_04340 [Proteobacteria bacterium]|nr:hypothetical protein [Pseudomonadota bacterium]